MRPIKQIERYVSGALSEDEAMSLWVHFLTKPNDFELFIAYLSLKTYYQRAN